MSFASNFILIFFVFSIGVFGTIYFIFNFLKFIQAQIKLQKALPAILGVDNNQIGNLSVNQKVEFVFNYLMHNVSSTGLDKLAKRPLLRDTALQTLESKVGHCGENSRLAINLFNLLGIRSNRVYLIGPHWGHVLIECFVNNKWYFFEGHNNEWSNFSSSDLLNIPSPDIKLLPNTSPDNPWTGYHRIKLFHNRFILDRFKYLRLPFFLVIVFENPHLIKSLIGFLLIIASLFLYLGLAV
jgi:hypothetical protein